ncbi:MerR family transcriptional regulator [Streptacidiphilus albus]|uniref:DNA polymerase III subunit beta family protein n=1 Tax=Streptacidiphilus albus TaxID=105425 RepID=UPI001E41F69B|nr:MerR family transcriptional regulator [Streptacidiphilus albus]
MENEMHSIGELARRSGLTVSALRFYDGAGVLVPAWVDPSSGYRWYAAAQLAEARLLARLRRVQLPLADIRMVLAGWAAADPSLVRKVLDEHLLRLEDGLADARRELSTVRELLALREIPMNTTTASAVRTRLTLSGAELAAALASVRFAVGTDPEFPMLAGVLLDITVGEPDGAGELRTVATDRYRMALSAAAVSSAEGPSVQVLVPATLIDSMRALLGAGTGADTSRGADTSAVLTVEGERITLEVGESRTAGLRIEADFPDYRRLSRLAAGRRVTVDVAALRTALVEGGTRNAEREQDGVAYAVSVLRLTAEGTVSVLDEATGAPGAPVAHGSDGRDGSDGGDGGYDSAQWVGVNREFLLDALAVSGRDQLVLELGGPITPLALRLPEREDTFSLLMPVRLEA